MKKIISALFLSVIMLANFSACTNDEKLDGEGTVRFRVSVSSDVDVLARTTSDDEATLAANCTVYVYKDDVLIRKYHSLSEVPSELVLISGNYSVEAWTGTSVPASFTDRYYYGKTAFTITKGSTETANVICKISNTVASVTFDASVNSVLKDYSVTIANTEGSLVFTTENANDVKGYYMMPEGETELTWTINGTSINGTKFQQTGTISDVKPAYEYALTIKHNPESSDFGGAFFTVDVDESEIKIVDNHLLTAAPEISISGYSLDEPIFGEEKSFRNLTIYVSATTTLADLSLTCDKFTTLGLPVNEIHFVGLNAATEAELAAKGISTTVTTTTDGATLTKLSIAKAFMDNLTNGEYTITISATDKASFKKTTTKTVNIIVSDAYVFTSKPNAADIFCYSAILRGTIAKETTGYGFKYRKDGDSDWTTTDATVTGSNFEKEITGLTPNTTYEYVAISDGFTATTSYTFTTGNVIQLPNGGFEEWYTISSGDEKGAMVPSPSESALFWDCGNHGSITLKINVTQPDNTIKHSGNYSIRLASDYPSVAGIGKFAAGNVFIGKYLKTDGTNGILGFGRPFNARPVALHGWVKYSPGKIDKVPGGTPSECKSGANDKGIIYIAMLDGTTESYSGQNWPLVIKTNKNYRRLFDKNESKVIGYGEMTWTEPTAGEGLIEFTIPINYTSSATPSNILITCSASYWGDFFAGSTSSKMWIDDLELIYK